jgi:hypothetical protein
MHRQVHSTMQVCLLVYLPLSPSSERVEGRKPEGEGGGKREMWGGGRREGKGHPGMQGTCW